MASAFTHAFSAVIMKKVCYPEKSSFELWYFTIACSVIPDADIIGSIFGIQYRDILGHRGFFHSIVFAFILGVVIAFFFFKNFLRYSIQWWRLILYFTIVTLSHSVFDAMTNGGLGVAFLAPFSETRYFFPWRPIEVSEFQIQRFFSEEGLNVLRSEFVWVWIPSILLMLALFIYRKVSTKKPNQ